MSAPELRMRLFHDKHATTTVGPDGARMIDFTIDRSRWVSVIEDLHGIQSVTVIVANHEDNVRVPVGRFEGPWSWNDGCQHAKTLIKAMRPFDPARTNIDHWIASTRAAINASKSREAAEAAGV